MCIIVYKPLYTHAYRPLIYLICTHIVLNEYIHTYINTYIHPYIHIHIYTYK